MVCGAISLLGHDQVSFTRTYFLVVGIFAVNQDHDVSVLLDRT
ncbi:unannotated protein [freshwater metagenome]|uniref:Unannotated protein n=1 Tax=freshwater metagenome TaxID=449393 RepID=A0A6J6XGL1_9ZZZZ